MNRTSKAPPLVTIDSLRGTLTMARVLAESGRQIDLGGLDQETAALCAAVQRLPREEALALRPLLRTLLQEVTILAATLPEPR